MPGCARRRSCSGAHGDVLPATTEKVVLKAESASGTVAGQVAVMGTGDIRRVSLVPGDAQPPPLALERIAEADQIVIGPGSLVHQRVGRRGGAGHRRGGGLHGGPGGLRLQPAPQVPETEGYDVAAHVAALARHDVTVDVVLCDTIGGMAIGTTDVPVHDVPLTGAEPPGPQPGQTGAGACRVCWHRCRRGVAPRP